MCGKKVICGYLGPVSWSKVIIIFLFRSSLQVTGVQVIPAGERLDNSCVSTKAKGDRDFRIYTWSKILMELIFNPCGEFR